MFLNIFDCISKNNDLLNIKHKKLINQLSFVINQIIYNNKTFIGIVYKNIKLNENSVEINIKKIADYMNIEEIIKICLNEKSLNKIECSSNLISDIYFYNKLRSHIKQKEPN